MMDQVIRDSVHSSNSHANRFLGAHKQRQKALSEQEEAGGVIVSFACNTWSAKLKDLHVAKKISKHVIRQANRRAGMHRLILNMHHRHATCIAWASS